MSKYKEKRCKICGKTYLPASGNQEYCLGCREEHRKEQRRVSKKKYYQEHTEKERAYSRKYSYEHKDKIRKYREKYLKTVRGQYFAYKAEATRARRQIRWELTIEEFGKIIKKPCYYCGEIKDKFSGVDRIDSDKEYTVGNCVPCCTICNHMKWIMSPKEFVERCERVVKYSKK